MQDMGGLSGVEPDEGLLAPREIGSSELIVDGERVVITEAEGSHIEHDLRLNTPYRIQGGNNDHNVISRFLGEHEDVVVWGVMDRSVTQLLQRRVSPTDLVEASDEQRDVRLGIVIAGPVLVLLGVGVLLASGQRLVLANLKSGVHAPRRAHRRG